MAAFTPLCYFEPKGESSAFEMTLRKITKYTVCSGTTSRLPPQYR
jgi:hypothetical protein